VTSGRWNLIAACLCTGAAALSAIAALISCLDAWTVLNDLSLAAAIVATAGGIAWILAAL
jgi:hypothetical protein